MNAPATVGVGGNQSYLLFKDIDLTGLRGFNYEYAALDQSGEIQIRLDSLAGPIVADTTFSPTGGWETAQTVEATLAQAVSGRHDLYFIVRSRELPDAKLLMPVSVTFEPEL